MASHESVQNTWMPGWRNEPDAFKQSLVNTSAPKPSPYPMQLVAVGYSGDLYAQSYLGYAWLNRNVFISEILAAPLFFGIDGDAVPQLWGFVTSRSFINTFWLYVETITVRLEMTECQIDRN